MIESKNENITSAFERDMNLVVKTITSILKAKNESYGDSALNPIRIFSKLDSAEQLKVRIDDKLSRLSRGSEYPGDDTIVDLIGYLVLFLIQRKRTEEAKD